MRYQQLDERAAMARPDPARFPPLTVAEHLGPLALAEVLARHFRQPAAVRDAVMAGVTWQQVAKATGCGAGAALRQFLWRLAGQRRLSNGAPGMDDPRRRFSRQDVWRAWELQGRVYVRVSGCRASRRQEAC
jgi:hypothetical protein